METPPLALRLASLEEDAEPWIIEKQMFEMLVGYLDPDKDVSAKTAAIALNKLAPMHREVNDDDEVETPASFLLETWGIFIKIAKQIKYNHPAQGRLVDLIVELTKLPPVTVEIWGQSMRLWADLPMFPGEMRESWIYPRPEDDSTDPFRQWENLNAFAARLFGAGLVKWYHFGVWTLRDALEENESLWQQERRDLAVCHVLAATQWIEFARHALYEYVATEGSEATDGSRVSNGPRPLAPKELGQTASGKLFNGPRGLSQERWEFWTNKFRNIAEADGGIGGEIVIMCRVLAARAAGQMTEMTMVRKVK